MVKKLIVGLGNPGAGYAGTRHNFGARAAGRFVKEVGTEALREKGIAVLLPTVSMNDSGQAVADFLRQTNLSPADILIVHDELELPLGEWKFQEGGGARGHNGVRSVHATLQTQDIPRLRLGIGRPVSEKEVSDYVLENFASEEETVVGGVTQAVVQWLSEKFLQ